MAPIPVRSGSLGSAPWLPPTSPHSCSEFLNFYIDTFGKLLLQVLLRTFAYQVLEHVVSVLIKTLVYEDNIWTSIPISVGNKCHASKDSKYESYSHGLPKNINVKLENTNLESGTDLCGGAETPQVDASSARWRRSLAAAIYNLHAARCRPLSRVSTIPAISSQL